jgi:N6-adenosine-specific RNA methylase IME4
MFFSLFSPFLCRAFIQMREMIEKVSYEPRIELFARETFEGWDCWGNEV